MYYKISNIEQDILNKKYNYIPHKPGVYKVINADNLPIEILATSTNSKAGIYNVADLQQRYNKQTNKKVLYIGKGKDLSRRIKQYVKFGMNKSSVHKGGRSIFQIQDYKNLYIEVIECGNCQKVEKCMLIDFKNNYNGLPMANRIV